MTDDEAFHELLHRIRSGDAEAAAELVRQYQPLIRFEARLRLTDPRLRRLWDSLDICQSALGNGRSGAATRPAAFGVLKPLLPGSA